MYLPQNSDDFAKSNRTHFSKTKIKPHLPKDPVGQRYVQYFWHPWSAIVAPVPAFVSKPAWRTIDYYLQPSQLWKLHQNSQQLVGIRFGSNTRYAIIDLDKGGDYHNLESINRIKSALEDIGIVDIIILQSSHSGGYHLIITFTTLQPTFNLACALEYALRDAGFIPRKGHLEIFPNVKPWAENSIINYNAIRCPMQPGSGALLLDDDLQPISDSVCVFLDYCDRAAVRQDLTRLKRAIKKARKRHNRELYRKKASANVEEWRANWEEIITTGWTGFGQTNTLLQILVGYGIVFLDLKGEALVKYAVEAAISAPGYIQYCRHQHEIEARVRHWIECTIRHQWFTPYASYPERLLGTFANTFAEAISGKEASYALINGIIKPKDNIIPFDRRQALNQQRSLEAQKRIRWAVNALEWGRGLPEGITDRTKAISNEYKQRFHKTLSQDTLRKHLHLWHPKWYITDPWAENSSNPCQINKDGHFNKTHSPEKNQKAQNPYQMDINGHFHYMKVLCLPPAATAPQGLESAEEVEQPDVSQSDSAVIQPVENIEFINSSNTSEINSNKTSNQLENSVHTNILQSNEFSSHHDFIYSCSSGTSLKPDNQNLSIMEDNGLGVVSIPAAVAPEPPQEIANSGRQRASEGNSTPASVTAESSLQSANNGLQSASKGDLTPAAVPLEQPLQNPNNGLHGASVGEETADVSYRIEELKRVTKLRLMAMTQARAKVQQYRLITGRILSTQERASLEMIAKMQFYLDSGCSVLVAEAEAWAAVNPGCLPFSLESAFAEPADE
ncbi:MULTISPECIES: hypothetical protein [Nostoc]|uniref:Replication protein n=1 Tax=Nostoc paludosum FACHB-159 TaxID=2692908 RepID=A0ABR8KHA1_9NOSO|nr:MULTISPECIES: hypothetical protein [Nostoc]MBD2682587.1 hypothetical protein [Nostoc sp. FACHB-857]MBD2738917.1 hypothetical protein [Nostoc paludosum FACHB-159]